MVSITTSDDNPMSQRFEVISRRVASASPSSVPTV